MTSGAFVPAKVVPYRDPFCVYDNSDYFFSISKAARDRGVPLLVVVRDITAFDHVPVIVGGHGCVRWNRPIYNNWSELATTRVVKPMDLNPCKPGSPTKPQKISIQPTYNQDHTWSCISITDYKHSSRNIVLHTHQSSNKVITTWFSSGGKVVLKQHTLRLITCQLHNHPNKSTTEDTRSDLARDLLIICRRMVTVSTVAVIHDIICNKGK